VRDATGGGSEATAADASTVQLTDTAAALTPPLQVLVNLLAVSRGQTVSQEVLGSGDASQPGQEFVLKKKPVTYLSDPSSLSGDLYSSTVRVWVNDIEWHEVQNFYGRSAGEQIFVTREDEQGQTHVQFLQLPSGVNNVVADYRYGSGAAVPPAGALSVLTRPFPGLNSVSNPVPPAGGSDPDPSAKVRTYAPRSVLTFGRAVSADDYEAIAAQAPGVARARSYWSWDADAQRAMPTIYVGDDDGAVTSAAGAIAAAADPNRPVKVLLATAVNVGLRLAVRRNPDYAADPLIGAVRAALLDPDTGLFGTNVVRIGGAVFESQIFAACLGVPGALAVTSLEFEERFSNIVVLTQAYRHDPGEGAFFRLSDDDLEVTAHV
jgi:predicted phage baseplate assembly protein